MYVDYITYSVAADTMYGHKLRDMYYRLAANPRAKPLRRLAVRGYVDDGLWVGYADNRVSVNISGSKAEDMLTDIIDNLRQDIDAYASISVSRLDLQQTHLVDFSVPDYIQSLVPSDGYKSMLITSKQDDIKGIGLYIGSALSDKRLRVYDKGAQIAMQSGKHPQDMYGNGGLVRIELVLRKQPAYKALAAIVNGERLSLYTAYRNACIKRIPQLESLLDMPIAPSGVDLSTDKLNRTEKWLMEQVLPALARVYVSNPTFYDEFMSSLYDRIRSSRLESE